MSSYAIIVFPGELGILVIIVERTMINSRTSAGRAKAKAKGVKFGRPSLKTSKSKGGKYIDPKKVIELKAKGMSARAISRFMECSITPVLKILKYA